MRYRVRCGCGESEIEKGMHEPWPVCHTCGNSMRHVFTSPYIVYNARDFYTKEKIIDSRYPIDYAPEG